MHLTSVTLSSLISRYIPHTAVCAPRPAPHLGCLAERLARGGGGLDVGAADFEGLGGGGDEGGLLGVVDHLAVNVVVGPENVEPHPAALVVVQPLRAQLKGLPR